MNKNSKKLDSIVKIDQSQLRNHLGEIVHGTVEEMLDTILDAEADALCQAQKYERTPNQVTLGTDSGRRGHCEYAEIETPQAAEVKRRSPGDF